MNREYCTYVEALKVISQLPATLQTSLTNASQLGETELRAADNRVADVTTRTKRTADSVRTSADRFEGITRSSGLSPVAQPCPAPRSPSEAEAALARLGRDLESAQRGARWLTDNRSRAAATTPAREAASMAVSPAPVPEATPTASATPQPDSASRRTWVWAVALIAVLVAIIALLLFEGGRK